MKLHLLLILNIIFNYFFRNFIINDFSLIFYIKIVSWICPFFNFFYKKSNSSPTCKSRRLLAIFLLKFSSNPYYKKINFLFFSLYFITPTKKETEKSNLSIFFNTSFFNFILNFKTNISHKNYSNNQ